jgi:hypothetical protein
MKAHRDTLVEIRGKRQDWLAHGEKIVPASLLLPRIAG